MLSVLGVVKDFGPVRALDNVSLTVEKGMVHSLIGPNGSGKTTLVKIIAGLIAPTSGSVVVDGHDVTHEPIAAKSVIGYVPDEPAVWPTMTGEEFSAF
jgi:ABC-2 type transport system ATP-binding protein